MELPHQVTLLPGLGQPIEPHDQGIHKPFGFFRSGRAATGRWPPRLAGAASPGGSPRAIVVGAAGQTREITLTHESGLHAAAVAPHEFSQEAQLDGRRPLTAGCDNLLTAARQPTTDTRGSIACGAAAPPRPHTRRV